MSSVKMNSPCLEKKNVRTLEKRCILKRLVLTSTIRSRAAFHLFSSLRPLFSSLIVPVLQIHPYFTWRFPSPSILLWELCTTPTQRGLAGGLTFPRWLPGYKTWSPYSANGVAPPRNMREAFCESRPPFKPHFAPTRKNQHRGAAPFPLGKCIAVFISQQHTKRAQTWLDNIHIEGIFI